MTPLERSLRGRIRRYGPIPVAEYMAAAAGDPAHGYYRTRDPFGRCGDFVTAPEISQIFGELLGLWCVAAWRRMGAPRPVMLVELGPGRGTQMADALRAARTDPAFRAAIELHLVESSETLRRRQRRALDGVCARWHDRFDDLPAGRPVLLLANEFFDALAREQYVRGADGWRRRYVGLRRPSGGLGVVAPAEPVDWTARIPPALRDAAPGAVFETCPAGQALIAALARRLTTDGGAALIVDYGHAASAMGDTVQAVSRHRAHDPFDAPGTADVSAQVDFQALAAAAAGAAVYGPVPQGVFLERLGIRLRADRLAASARPDQAEAIRAGCRRLTHPGEMGALFKAFAVAQPGLGPLAGFEACGPARSRC